MFNIFVLTLGCCFVSTNANPYLQSPFKLLEAFHQCRAQDRVSIPNAEDKLSISMPLTSSKLPFLDAKYACLNNCALEKSGILTPDKEINTGKVPKFFVPLVNECNEMSKSLDDCEKAHNLTVCVIGKARELLNSTVMDCASKTKTEVDLDKGFKLRDFLQESKYYCMNRCVLIEIGMIDDANAYHMEFVAFMAPSNANVQEIVDKCNKDEDDRDQCKMVAKRERCVVKKIGKLAYAILND